MAPSHPLRLQTLRQPPLFRPLLLLLLALGLGCSVVALTGCQTTATGTTSAPTSLQTFDQVYSTSVQALTLILKETSVALSAGGITAAQAKTIVGYTDAIKTVLDAALAAENAANSSLATADVAQATAQIAAIGICLTQKPLTAATFATCTKNFVALTAVTP